jgi:hypothetical protein
MALAKYNGKIKQQVTAWIPTFVGMVKNERNTIPAEAGIQRDGIS